jgi:hypothetical protein
MGTQVMMVDIIQEIMVMAIAMIVIIVTINPIPNPILTVVTIANCRVRKRSARTIYDISNNLI